MKQCTKCKQLKNSSLYNTDKRHKDGLQSRCKRCQRDWKIAHKADLQKYRKTYYLANKERENKNSKKWNSAHKQLKAKYDAKYNKKPEVKIRKRLRRRFEAALQHATSKSSKSRKYIGCSIQELRDYLQKLFKPGMSWENYGFRGWHIDHIKPLCAFDLSCDKEIKKAFNYKNLQPLWAKDNLKKGGRYGRFRQHSSKREKNVRHER